MQRNILIKEMKIGIIFLFLYIVITGFLYPITITLFAQLFFPHQANGSLIKQNGNMIGSELIGQHFTDAKYFWGRPSATKPFPYNGESSSGSNLGPLNPHLYSTIQERVSQARNNAQDSQVPVDLVTSSGSGLDPDISALSAFYQIPRIAKARNMTEKELQALVQNHIQTRTWKLLGEYRVNVLLLNLALDHRKI